MIQKRRRSSIAPVLLLAAAVVAASCESPTRVNDPRINHPIKVVKETMSMTVRLPAEDEGLNGIELVSFQRFVQRFLESGQGQLRVEAAAVDRAQALLVKEGVRAGQIAVAPGGPGGDRAVLSYVAAVAVPPECEDWGSNATYNWSNKTHSNFGCSIQRNLGLMVSDPSDLEKAKPMTGADGERNAAIVNNYRTPTTKAGAKQATAKGATK